MVFLGCHLVKPVGGEDRASRARRGRAMAPSKNVFTYDLSPRNAAATWALLKLPPPRLGVTARGTTDDDRNGSTRHDDHPTPGEPRSRGNDGGAGADGDGGDDPGRGSHRRRGS